MINCSGNAVNLNVLIFNSCNEIMNIDISGEIYLLSFLEKWEHLHICPQTFCTEPEIKKNAKNNYIILRGTVSFLTCVQ